MNRIIILVAVLFLGTFNCKIKKEKVETMDPHKIDTSQSSKKEDIKEERLFLTKDEMDFTDTSDTYVSSKNEVIVFRPTEFNFGKMVEENQSDELVEFDGMFEELTNTISDTFKATTLTITICEKPTIAIAIENDTLYLDAHKHMYGIVFHKKGEVPVFKKGTEDHLISQIKNHFNL